EAAGKPSHAVLDGLALSVARRRRGGRRRLGRRKLRVGLRRSVARDGVLELAHPGAERATDLGEPLAAEEQQGDQENQDDVPGLRQTAHCAESSTVSERVPAPQWRKSGSPSR